MTALQPPVLLRQVSTMLSGGARESEDNVSGRSNGLKKGVMGWGNTNQFAGRIGTKFQG